MNERSEWSLSDPKSDSSELHKEAVTVFELDVIGRSRWFSLVDIVDVMGRCLMMLRPNLTDLNGNFKEGNPKVRRLSRRSSNYAEEVSATSVPRVPSVVACNYEVLII